MIAVDEDIARLHVAMDDATAMRRRQSVGDIGAPAQNMLERQWLAADAMCERFAFQQFHHDE